MIERRLAGLDLVRAAAAAAVALSHFCTGKAIVPEFTETLSVLAVEVFFVLSGFVLAPQLVFCLRSSRWHALRTFVLRRLMRTVPPYMVALGSATIMYAAWAKPTCLKYFFYAQALFSGPGAADYYPVAWSLSVEEWAYATFALLIAVSWALPKTVRSIVTVSCLVVVACAVARLFAPLDDSWGSEVRRVSVFRVDAIAFGVLLRVAVDRFAPALRGGLRLLAVNWLLSVLTGFSVAYLAGWNDSVSARIVFPFTSAYFGASTILLFVGMESHLPQFLLRMSRWMGNISYSLYLFHALILSVILTRLQDLNGTWQFLLYGAACVAFCSAFFDVVERPVLALRPRYATRPRTEPGEVGQDVDVQAAGASPA